MHYNMVEPCEVSEIISIALDRTKSLNERMDSVDMLRLSKNSLSVPTLVSILLSNESDAALKKNCEDSILFFGKKAIPYIDEVMADTREFMVYARNSKNKFPYDEVLEANEAQHLLQLLMSEINNGSIRDKGEFKKPENFPKKNKFAQAKTKAIKQK